MIFSIWVFLFLLSKIESCFENAAEISNSSYAINVSPSYRVQDKLLQSE